MAPLHPKRICDTSDGKIAPFSLETRDGTHLNSESFRGKHNTMLFAPTGENIETLDGVDPGLHIAAGDGRPTGEKVPACGSTTSNKLVVPCGVDTLGVATGANLAVEENSKTLPGSASREKMIAGRNTVAGENAKAILKLYGGTLVFKS